MSHTIWVLGHHTLNKNIHISLFPKETVLVETVLGGQIPYILIPIPLPGWPLLFSRAKTVSPKMTEMTKD